MSIELNHPQQLTTEQLAIADIIVDSCELADVANQTIDMYGQSGTVRSGLGRCAAHLANMNPSDIRDLVHGLLEAQSTRSQSNG